MSPWLVLDGFTARSVRPVAVMVNLIWSRTWANALTARDHTLMFLELSIAATNDMAWWKSRWSLARVVMDPYRGVQEWVQKNTRGWV